MNIPFVPTSTYRLQFRGDMDFGKASMIVPYLRDLGISHLYASPLFQAVRGSSHGYDVTDHGCFDEVLGGQQGFLELSDTLKKNRIGLILDIVPNHMAASVENRWWADILRNGPSSRYADYFDIDWNQPKITLPILARGYGDILASGDIKIISNRDLSEFSLKYFDHELPLSDVSIDFLKSYAEQEAWGHIDANLIDQINKDVDILHRIHEQQYYRLTDWRLARDGLTYRRFFEVADLVGVRVEASHVFDDVHRFVFDLIDRGHIHGLRIDHIDGLEDPTGYLRRLSREMPQQVPIWVEKICARGEQLRDDWPVFGTTGYEFIDIAGSILTPKMGVSVLSDQYDQYVRKAHEFEDMRLKAKREILTFNLASEFQRLVNLVFSACCEDLSARDFGYDRIRLALIDILCAMRVYRTYLESGEAAPRDVETLKNLKRELICSRFRTDQVAVQSILQRLIAEDGDVGRELRARFQQISGALMAKSIEDTLFYRYNLLISNNEVGGHPEVPSLTPEEFHDFVVRPKPTSLNCTATHDTKRGEDARMRIASIAEYPEQWCRAVEEFDGILRSKLDDMISEEFRWMFYQALLGAWERPSDSFRERTKAFALKAIREAKLHTSWLSPCISYEGRVLSFIDDVFSNNEFLWKFDQHIQSYLKIGERKSLVQLALKLTVPGIPDIYQGTERYDLSFVDPDNRRPVDFDELRDDLSRLGVESADNQKIELMKFILCLRQNEDAMFDGKSYHPISFVGNNRCLGFWRSGIRSDLFAIVDLSGGSELLCESFDIVPDREPRVRFPEIIDDKDDVFSTLRSRSVYLGVYDRG